MYRRAFTLLELLITTSIFVVVAVISTSVFTVTARFQSVAKQSQQNTTQARTAAYVMKDAIERSIHHNVHPHIFPNNVAGKQMFFTLARNRLPDGRLSSEPLEEQWELYCVEDNAGIKRLARFTSPPVAREIDEDLPRLINCDLDGFKSLLKVDTNAKGPEYLTSDQVDVEWIVLRHSGLSSRNNPPIPSALYAQVAVYDIEVATVFDPTNSGVERRANDRFSAVGQVVIRTVANHRDPHTELNSQQ